jgi:hypothetical protein
MQCRWNGPSNKSMLKVFDGVNVPQAYKDLVRPAAPGKLTAIPWDSRPGTLFLHLAEGFLFKGAKGNCSKCNATTTAGR